MLDVTMRSLCSVPIVAAGPSPSSSGISGRAWGPMFSPQNLAVKPFAQNRAELTDVLANLLHDGTDRWAVWAVAGAVGQCPGPAVILHVQDGNAFGCHALAPDQR